MQKIKIPAPRFELGTFRYRLSSFHPILFKNCREESTAGRSAIELGGDYL